ncbi:hypothetical protein MHYP_G00345830 [Metynnis hypsauchen]
MKADTTLRCGARECSSTARSLRNLHYSGGEALTGELRKRTGGKLCRTTESSSFPRETLEILNDMVCPTVGKFHLRI